MSGVHCGSAMPIAYDEALDISMYTLEELQGDYDMSALDALYP